MVKNINSTSSVQLSLFPLDGTSVNDAQTACIPAAGVTNYLKTREALWRMLASYPKRMTVEDAVRRARVDFTKCRKEVAV